MNNGTKQDDNSMRSNVLGADSSLPSARYISATILFVIGFVLGIVIPLGMFAVFKDGCTEVLQRKTPNPVEIIHYHPGLMVVCVLIMCLFFLGLYALYCHFMSCIVREDTKIEKIRKGSF